MTAYGGADQGAPAGAEQPKEPVEPPADTHPPAPAVALSEPPPEIPSSAPQATPQPPPVIPPPSAPSPSAELRVAIPILEYRGLSHTYQAQHTAILRQIQHHLGIISAPEHAIPSSSEPSQAPPFVDQPMPHQEPPTGEAAEPSFPQHHPPTI
ncbi:proline-rich receptor-like protein kinase PERK9 [Vitis vinifera]|uniref:proline-rich receptor-like protein kinase PERK9 n=1 Tax=Vitis vinifera TaxID=29760 RepID=UPI0028835048|nr:proline-rich receptor-like protein kinase PERK9 [Vitis vinifera]